jgi:hypothetical protein
MIAAKKSDSSSSASARKGHRPVWLLALLGMALLLGVIGGPYLAWRKLKPRILGSPEYRVGPEQVEITPAPAWIHSDIRAEVFRDPSLDGPLWLTDDNLTEQIAAAFSLHPWVAKVTRVTKRHPASTNPAAVKVELVYRQPVCMVEVPGGVLAVDAEGVLLPSEDFSPIEATRYPRLVGADQKPNSPPGRRWADAKVVGGAEIAAALGPVWEAMRLQRIVPLAATAVAAMENGADPSDRRAREPIFALFTRAGTQITWGYAPGANMLGEPPAAEKVVRLQRYLAVHDTLDGPQGQPQKVDVRTLPLAESRP